MPECTYIGTLDRAKLRLFARRVSHWFKDHGRDLPWRHSDQSLYRRIVCEVLLQRTRAKTVAEAYEAFFETYSNWAELAQADRHGLESTLRPLGLWRQRAPRLNAFAQAMIERRGKFPETREKLLAIPAVGHYVANSILLFAHDQPEPLLDTNMSRVLERYFGGRKLADIRHDRYLNSLAKAVVETGDSIQLNWAILDFAAVICTGEKPRCTECPLSETCKHNAEKSIFDKLNS